MTSSMRQLMHEDDVVLYFEDRAQCHGAILRANEIAKAMVAGADHPKRWHLILGEDRDDITIRQRGFLHKAVFPQIAEQVTFPVGTRYTWQVWKEHYRARFLGDRWEMRATPRWDDKAQRIVQPKRATPHRVRVSTEDLSVKQYSEYIDRIIDSAAAELGVIFDFVAEEREAVRYRRPVRPPKVEQREAETT
jgi:hypothetical protein